MEKSDKCTWCIIVIFVSIIVLGIIITCYITNDSWFVNIFEMLIISIMFVVQFLFICFDGYKCKSTFMDFIASLTSIYYIISLCLYMIHADYKLLDALRIFIILSKIITLPLPNLYLNRNIEFALIVYLYILFFIIYVPNVLLFYLDWIDSIAIIYDCIKMETHYQCNTEYEILFTFHMIILRPFVLIFITRIIMLSRNVFLNYNFTNVFHIQALVDTTKPHVWVIVFVMMLLIHCLLPNVNWVPLYIFINGGTTLYLIGCNILCFKTTLFNNGDYPVFWYNFDIMMSFIGFSMFGIALWLSNETNITWIIIGNLSCNFMSMISLRLFNKISNTYRWIIWLHLFYIVDSIPNLIKCFHKYLFNAPLTPDYYHLIAFQLSFTYMDINISILSKYLSLFTKNSIPKKEPNNAAYEYNISNNISNQDLSIQFDETKSIELDDTSLKLPKYNISNTIGHRSSIEIKNKQLISNINTHYKRLNNNNDNSRVSIEFDENKE